MKITISDRANALLQLDLELERLETKHQMLEAELRQNNIYQMVIKRSMRDILSDGTYEIHNVGIQPQSIKDKFEQDCI